MKRNLVMHLITYLSLEIIPVIVACPSGKIQIPAARSMGQFNNFETCAVLGNSPTTYPIRCHPCRKWGNAGGPAVCTTEQHIIDAPPIGGVVKW